VSAMVKMARPQDWRAHMDFMESRIRVLSCFRRPPRGKPGEPPPQLRNPNTGFRHRHVEWLELTTDAAFASSCQGLALIIEVRHSVLEGCAVLVEELVPGVAEGGQFDEAAVFALGLREFEVGIVWERGPCRVAAQARDVAFAKKGLLVEQGIARDANLASEALEKLQETRCVERRIAVANEAFEVDALRAGRRQEAIETKSFKVCAEPEMVFASNTIAPVVVG
jgi:hypothetical protein